METNAMAALAILDLVTALGSPLLSDCLLFGEERVKCGSERREERYLEGTGVLKRSALAQHGTTSVPSSIWMARGDVFVTPSKHVSNSEAAQTGLR